MTLSRRSGVGEATVRNASDARRRHRRCRRATPTQNPSDSWVGASLPHSEPRTGASAPLHSYQVWPPGGSNAGSLNLRYRQRPILIKNLRISLCRNHVFLYSDSIGSETGRSAWSADSSHRPRRWQRQRLRRVVGRWSRSFEGSWLVYTPQRSDGTGCWSLGCHGRRRLMSSAVADVVADRRHRHRHRRAHRRRRARRRRHHRRARRRRRRTSAACCSCPRAPLLRDGGSDSASPVAAAAVAKGRRCRQARSPRAATAATTSRLTDSDGATSGRRIICHSRQPRPFSGTLCRSHRAKVAISALLYALSVASESPPMPHASESPSVLHAWGVPLPPVPPLE